MSMAGKEDLIWRVEAQRGHRSQVLNELRIPRSTYYKWRKGYRGDGLEGLTKRKPLARRVWNRLMVGERERVLEVARLHPELSSRLLAVKITDEEAFSVSESTVYRILRENNLICLRPLPEMPAQEQWKHKTTHPDELWQCDWTTLFIVGWGYYNLIPVVDLSLENAREEGHLTETDPMPKLYSDNGSGFTSTILAEYLSVHGIKHIFSRPYHPQGRGKIERFNRRIKEKVCLTVYCSPGELRKALDEAIAIYNRTPHEALANVSPNDVYAGRKEVVLQRRQEKKRLTLESRKQYNLNTKNEHPGQPQNANSP